MASIAYEVTGDGVYVQSQYSPPDDEDWSEMLAYVRARGAIIRAVLVDGREGATPSPRQRQLLAREIGALSVDVKFALLIDSRFSRGALMALSWISGRGDKMRAFPTARTEDAMLFLGLSTHARERVYEVLKRQRGSAISQAG